MFLIVGAGEPNMTALHYCRHLSKEFIRIIEASASSLENLVISNNIGG